jgi:branched-chain amino acid transport system substrate-binding protein
MNKNTFIATAAFCAMLGASPMRADIKIGVILPTTGSEETCGIDMLHTIQLAADEINAKGGVLGQKFTLEAVDDACDPQTAVAAASKLVSLNVDAVVGGYCSGATLPTLKIYGDAGIPFMISTANSPKFLSVDMGTAFQMNAAGIFQVDTAMSLFNKLGVKRVAVIHQGDGYSEGVASLTKEKWTGQGKELVAYEMVTKGEPDMSSLVTRIRSRNADMVFWTAYFADGALLIKQLRQGGYRGKIVVGDGCMDEHLITIGGKATEGVFCLSNPTPEFVVGGKAFAAKYKAKFGVEPGPYSALTYDSFMLLANAYKRAGTKDKPAVLKALAETKDFHGLTGDLTYGDKHYRNSSNYVLLEVKNQKWALSKAM